MNISVLKMVLNPSHLFLQVVWVAQLDQAECCHKSCSLLLGQTCLWGKAESDREVCLEVSIPTRGPISFQQFSKSLQTNNSSFLIHPPPQKNRKETEEGMH